MSITKMGFTNLTMVGVSPLFSADIVKKLVSLGAKGIFLANRADGNGPLSGNDSPWKDLSGNNNDGILLNFAGVPGSQWDSEGGQYYLDYDQVDDIVEILSQSSGDALDFTDAPAIITSIVKLDAIEKNGYAISRNLNGGTADQQYAVQLEAPFMGVVFGGSKIQTAQTPYLSQWVHLLGHWTGTSIDLYVNFVPIGSTPKGPTISSKPNSNFGGRSNEVDNSRKTFLYRGPQATAILYNDVTLDFDAIVAEEEKLFAPYLALNP